MSADSPGLLGRTASTYRTRVVLRHRVRGFLRRAAPLVARVLVLLVMVLAIGRGSRGILVCTFTNEVLSKCCCPREKSPHEGPSVVQTCCCRTTLVSPLPEAALPERDDATLRGTAPPLVALAAPLLAPMRGPEARHRLEAREIGPPRSLPERLALLQVLHL